MWWFNSEFPKKNTTSYCTEFYFVLAQRILWNGLFSPNSICHKIIIFWKLILILSIYIACILLKLNWFSSLCKAILFNRFNSQVTFINSRRNITSFLILQKQEYKLIPERHYLFIHHKTLYIEICIQEVHTEKVVTILNVCFWVLYYIYVSYVTWIHTCTS